MDRSIVGCLFFISFLILCQSSILIELPNTTPSSCKLVQWLNDFPQESHLLVLSSTILPNTSMEGIYIAEAVGLVQYIYVPDQKFVQRLQHYQNIGVLGFVVIEFNMQDPGSSALSKSLGFHFPSNLTIPIGLISPFCYKETAGRFPNGVNVTVLGWDTNEWLVFVNSSWYIVWFVSLTLFFVFNMGFALYKLVMGYFIYKRGINISFICLSLECIANLIRTFQMILTPFLNTFLLPNVRILLTLAQPFGISSSILLIFFWLDLTSGSLYQGNLLSVMKIPTIVTICFLFIVEIGQDSYRVATGFSYDAGYIMVAVYTIIHTLTALFYFYAAFKIFRFRKDFSKEKAKHLNRITTQVVFCGVAILVTTFFIICYMIEALFATPAGTFTILYMMWFSFFPQSLLQIIVFGNNEKKTPSDSIQSSVVPKTE